MVILEDEKTIFVHIPKCGGTSVTASLDEVARWNDIFVGGTDVGEYLNRTWGIRFKIRKHSTPDEIRLGLGKLRYQEYKKFILVRNPVDRFLSAYNFMLRHIAQRSEWIMPAAAAYGLDRFTDFEDFLFSDFISDVVEDGRKWSVARFDDLEQARVAAGVVRMYLPQIYYYDPDEAKKGRFLVLKLEDASRFDFFMKSVGVDRGLELKIHNSNDMKTIGERDLSARALDRLCDLYSTDFSSFEYPRPSGIGFEVL